MKNEIIQELEARFTYHIVNIKLNGIYRSYEKRNNPFTYHIVNMKRKFNLTAN